MNTIFIQTNDKQDLGAMIAQYALQKHMEPHTIPVTIMNVDTMDMFQSFHEKTYRRNGRLLTFDRHDLQSFTLSRFLPPSLMGYEGKVLVIDPDIFSLVNIHELFALDMHGYAIACCRKKDAWDSSLMLLDCAKLRHWDVPQFLRDLHHETLDYTDLMMLKKESDILELPRIWNSLDHLDDKTKLLHTTNRLTQPWKTGLPIDFRREPLKKIGGIIPREWVWKKLGKYSTTYQPHPQKHIETFFFGLVKEALATGVLSRDFIQSEIDAGHARKDTFALL